MENAKKREEKENAIRQRDQILESCRGQMDRKAAKESFIKSLHIERREAEKERLLARAKESQGWRESELEQEELLAQELGKHKHQDFVEFKRRQQILETPELRMIQNEIRKAYATKELMLQLTENKYKNELNKIIEAESLKDKLKNDELFKQQEVKLKEEEEKRKKEYRARLQDQMTDKQKRKEEEYAQFLEEKALIDAAVKVILDEDRLEEETRELMKKKTNEEKELFWKAREYWIQKEREEEELEDRRVKLFLEEKMKREEEYQEQNRRKVEKLLKQRAHVSQMLASISDTREETEAIKAFLVNEEHRAKEEQREREDLEKKIRQKFEMKEIIARHLEEHMKKLEEQRNKDIEESKQMMARFIEESRLEQLTKEKRRRMELDYGKQLKDDIEKKHKERLMEMQEEKTLIRLQEAARLERRRLIEEERLRLLKEHAGKLVGFLPKGVLRESDFPYLSPDVQTFYGYKEAKDDGEEPVKPPQ